MRDSKGKFVKGNKPWNTGKNVHLSPKTEFKKGDNLGAKNNRWKGGIKNKASGYIYLKADNHPYANCDGYVAEHRLVMEKHLGRYLKPKEVVHHIDSNKKNNKINNLMLFINDNEHQKHHRSVKNEKEK